MTVSDAWASVYFAEAHSLEQRSSGFPKEQLPGEGSAPHRSNALPPCPRPARRLKDRHRQLHTPHCRSWGYR